MDTPAEQLMRWFKYDHLREGPGRDASTEIAYVAQQMNERLPDGPEKTTGLRKLLEAKDCFVRAAISDDS